MRLLVTDSDLIFDPHGLSGECSEPWGHSSILLYLSPNYSPTGSITAARQRWVLSGRCIRDRFPPRLVFDTNMYCTQTCVHEHPVCSGASRGRQRGAVDATEWDICQFLSGIFPILLMWRTLCHTHLLLEGSGEEVWLPAPSFVGLKYKPVWFMVELNVTAGFRQERTLGLWQILLLLKWVGVFAKSFSWYNIGIPVQCSVATGESSEFWRHWAAVNTS